MCNDRERLIGYVYDECDASERAVIEAHLASCPECRADIAGLRSVRQDLLAWGVPEHGSVWRPFVPVRVAPSWRDLPAWGLAAAASFLLVAGAAGGVATQALWPRPAAPVAASAPATPTVVRAQLTDEDVSALEARVLARLRAELDEKIRSVSVGQRAVGQPPVSREELINARLEEFGRAVSADMERLSNRTGNLERNNNLILTSLMTDPDTLGPGMGR